MGIQTKLACVSCGPRLLPSPANMLSLDDVSFPNKSSNMDRGGVSIKIDKQWSRLQTTLYTIMVVPWDLYSKFLSSVPEKDQQSASENLLLEYYVFYYQAFYWTIHKNISRTGGKKYTNYISGLWMMWPNISIYFSASPSIPILLKIISFQKLPLFPSSSGADKKESCSTEFINTVTFYCGSSKENWRKE
jgi:hypothetical protein